MSYFQAVLFISMVSVWNRPRKVLHLMDCISQDVIDYSIGEHSVLIFVLQGNAAAVFRGRSYESSGV